jgi:hypothetical protein
MKAQCWQVLLVGGAIVLGAPVVALAQQTGGLPRVDTWGALGWQHLSNPDEDSHTTYDTRPAIGLVGAGFYWAPHLKTEIDIGTASRASFYRIEHLPPPSPVLTRYTRLTYKVSSTAAVQTYEFLSNAWFTPFLGAGLEVSRQSVEEYVDPVIELDPVTHQPRQTQPAHEPEPEHRTIVRPVAAVGFKAYMSRRAFFRADTRLTFKSGIEHVLIRFGFGVDF